MKHRWGGCAVPVAGARRPRRSIRVCGRPCGTGVAGCVGRSDVTAALDDEVDPEPRGRTHPARAPGEHRGDHDPCLPESEAELDTSTYDTGMKVTDTEIDALAMTRHRFHGDWNYTLHPRAPRNTPCSGSIPPAALSAKAPQRPDAATLRISSQPCADRHALLRTGRPRESVAIFSEPKAASANDFDNAVVNGSVPRAAPTEEEMSRRLLRVAAVEGAVVTSAVPLIGVLTALVGPAAGLAAGAVVIEATKATQHRKKPKSSEAPPSSGAVKPLSVAPGSFTKS